MSAIQEKIFDDGSACSRCRHSVRTAEPWGEKTRGCSASDCDEAIRRVEDARDYFVRIKDAGAEAVCDMLAHYDLAYEIVPLVFFARTSTAGAESRFVEEILAPAIFRNGYWFPKEKAA